MRFPLTTTAPQVRCAPFVTGRSLAPFRLTCRCYASARLYSLVETSKASGLEPHAYFTQSHRHLGYVPVRTLAGNHTCLLAGMLAHNLGRELRMTAYPQ